MKGTTLSFKKQVQVGTDAFNNPITEIQVIDVDDCLIAPIIEAASQREQQALEQGRDQIRIHLPKTYTGDISSSTITWDGKDFKVDVNPVSFMNENTPTRWNRYFRAESINA